MNRCAYCIFITGNDNSQPPHNGSEEGREPIVDAARDDEQSERERKRGTTIENIYNI